MTTVIGRGVLKGTLLGTVQTRSMFTYEIASYTDVADENTLVDGYLHSIFDDLVPAICNAWQTTTVEVQRWTSPSWYTLDEHAINVSGTNSGAPAPNFLSPVFIAKSLGVRKIGRKFIPGVVLSNISQNTLITSVMTQLGTAFLAYITPYTETGLPTLTPGILDKTGTFYAFLGGFVSSLLGTMRRRKPGLGI